MINVTLSHLILLCMTIGLVMVILGSVSTVVRRKRREVQRRKGVILCRICGVRYEGGNEDMTVCPACQTPNEFRPPDLI